MDELINKNERIDRDLEQLEIHSPSMRFTKSVVESVKAETNLITEEKTMLPWIPKVCIAGFIALSICLIAVFVTGGSMIDTSKKAQIVQLFNYLLIGTSGLVLLYGLDFFLKRKIV